MEGARHDIGERASQNVRHPGRGCPRLDFAQRDQPCGEDHGRRSGGDRGDQDEIEHRVDLGRAKAVVPVFDAHRHGALRPQGPRRQSFEGRRSSINAERRAPATWRARRAPAWLRLDPPDPS